MYRNAWPLLAFATYKKILTNNEKPEKEVNGHEFAVPSALTTGQAR
jgi:hypothetical protein